MKNVLFFVLTIASTPLFSQATFNGNVREMESKNVLSNVTLMVVEEKDTSYFTPDVEGNFSFKTKPGRVRIFAEAEGYLSELNSVNAGDGSKNNIDISMVKVPVEKLFLASTFGADSSTFELDEVFIATKTIHKNRLASDAGRTVVYSASDEHRTGTEKAVGTVSTDVKREERGVAGEGLGTKMKYRISMDGGVVRSDEKSGVLDLVSLKGSRSAGQNVLTAGEVNDFSKWGLWNDLSKAEFDQFSVAWKLLVQNRFCVQLSLPSGIPLIDAEVQLTDNSGRVVWNARTDNTGKAELWDLVPIKDTKLKYYAKVSVGSYTESFRNVISFGSGINYYTIDLPCTVSDQLDIAFVVDATGSMGDEINYLKLDLDNVISLISEENKNINLRMGSVFYRDKTDQYLTIESPFSSNTELVKSFILAQSADGGGDAPEAADEALMVALQKLNWSTSSRARILFWILDAPPHQAEENIARMKDVATLAASMGVRIVPVGCSGITKSTEFLCRSIALATNGTYTFLTNHSGVGASHIEPSTDGYKVESFRDVLVRVARQMSITSDCQEFISDRQIDLIDTNLAINNPYGLEDSVHVYRHNYVPPTNEICISAYPNPTTGLLNVKHTNSIKELFLADVNGKLLERFALKEDSVDRFDLGRYTNGIYLIQFYNGQKWNVVKIVLQH
jgi:hypothetical protein